MLIVKWGKTMRKKLTVCCTAFLLVLSLTYIPLRRIGYSLLTVLISGQLIGLVQKLPLPWDKPRPEAAE